MSVYARALAEAQRSLDPESRILVSGASVARWRRWACALWPRYPRARHDGQYRLAADDVFRGAQIGFDLWRRPTAIRLPGPPGIMHWSYPMPLCAPGWRNIYTIHDLIPLLRPDLTPIAERRHRRLLHAIVASADLLVTVSEASRGEIIEMFGCPPDRVVNCGVAISTEAPAEAPPAGLSRRGYLLVLGSVEPRKNIERIIAAYDRSGVSLPLVIAGPSGWKGEVIMAKANAISGIIRLPWLPDAERHSLLANAHALLMPSLAEGFGIPVIEAMACGVPVLCSRTGALAETAGDAAWLVDPNDIEALATGMRRITSENCLRTTLISAGRANARRFTPTIFTQALGAAYARLLATPPGDAYRRP